MNEAKNSTTPPTEMVAIPLVKLDNLIAAVEQLKAGKLRAFMYAIHVTAGEVQINESCLGRSAMKGGTS